MGNFNVGLDNRCRDNDGEIGRKRGDTRIDTLREAYGPDFANGYRGDAHLETVLEREEVESLSEYLRNRR